MFTPIFIAQSGCFLLRAAISRRPPLKQRVTRIVMLGLGLVFAIFFGLNCWGSLSTAWPVGRKTHSTVVAEAAVSVVSMLLAMLQAYLVWVVDHTQFLDS